MTHFLTLWSCWGCHAPVGVSSSSLMCYSERVCAEAQGLEEVRSYAILDLFGSNRFMSCPHVPVCACTQSCPNLRPREQ